MRFESCKFVKASFRDCRLKDVVFKNLDVTGLKVQGLELSDATIDGNEALERLLKPRC